MSPRTRWMRAFARCLNGRRSQAPQRDGAQLICLASQAQGRQGGDGGERRLRAGLGQGAARGRHRGADRRSQAGAQLRPIGRPARQERCDRCGDDRLVRRDLSRGAGPGLRRGTREAGANRECASGPARAADQPAKQGRAFRTGSRAENAGAALEEDRRRSCQARGCDRSPDQGHGAFCRTRRDHRERAGACQDHRPPA